MLSIKKIILNLLKEQFAVLAAIRTLGNVEILTQSNKFRIFQKIVWLFLNRE